MALRALIVEDDPALRRALAREILKGFEVLLAGNGVEAIEMLNEIDELQAVISDRDLGPGPDGLTVLQEARRRDPSCARILVTGDISDELMEEVIRAEIAHCVFLKPWGRSEVLKAALDAVANPPVRAAEHGTSGVRVKSEQVAEVCSRKITA